MKTLLLFCRGHSAAPPLQARCLKCKLQPGELSHQRVQCCLQAAKNLSNEREVNPISAIITIVLDLSSLTNTLQGKAFVPKRDIFPQPYMWKLFLWIPPRGSECQQTMRSQKLLFKIDQTQLRAIVTRSCVLFLPSSPQEKLEKEKHEEPEVSKRHSRFPLTPSFTRPLIPLKISFFISPEAVWKTGCRYQNTRVDVIRWPRMKLNPGVGMCCFRLFFPPASELAPLSGKEQL